jgi:hypothetical protein
LHKKASKSKTTEIVVGSICNDVKEKKASIKQIKGIQQGETKAHQYWSPR